MKILPENGLKLAAREVIKTTKKIRKPVQSKPIDARTVYGSGISLNNYSPILTDNLMVNNFADYTKRFEAAGISKIIRENEYIYIRTNKGICFRIEKPVDIPDDAVGLFALCEAENRTSNFGLQAFVKFVDKYQRFDILKKGLFLNSNEIFIADDAQKTKAAKKLSKMLKKHIDKNNLFASQNEVFYADLRHDTVYCVGQTKLMPSDNSVSACKLITNDKGIVIGYEKREYDLVSGCMKTRTYLEQQKPENEIPSVVNRENYTEYAQACRFGNFKPSERYDKILSKILYKLKSGGLKNVKKENIMGVKYLNREQRNTNFTYFNEENGRSILFDKDGNFIYQLEYVKNDEGKIINGYKYL